MSVSGQGGESTVGAMGAIEGKLDYLKRVEEFEAELREATSSAHAQEIIAKYKSTYSNLTGNFDGVLRRVASEGGNIGTWFPDLVAVEPKGREWRPGRQ